MSVSCLFGLYRYILSLYFLPPQLQVCCVSDYIKLKIKETCVSIRGRQLSSWLTPSNGRDDVKQKTKLKRSLTDRLQYYKISTSLLDLDLNVSVFQNNPHDPYKKDSCDYFLPPNTPLCSGKDGGGGWKKQRMAVVGEPETNCRLWCQKLSFLLFEGRSHSYISWIQKVYHQENANQDYFNCSNKQPMQPNWNSHSLRALLTYSDLLKINVFASRRENLQDYKSKCSSNILINMFRSTCRRWSERERESWEKRDGQRRKGEVVSRYLSFFAHSLFSPKTTFKLSHDDNEHVRNILSNLCHNLVRKIHFKLYFGTYYGQKV